MFRDEASSSTPVLYDVPVHHALRPFTVLVRYWPQLAACYLIGLLGRQGAIALAAWAGHDDDFWASAIMPLAGIARLGSYVAMFLLIRRGFPELAALPVRSARRVDLFSSVVVPFYAIYLAWQMFKEDWLAFEARALDYRLADAMTSPNPTVLHPESLPVGMSTWVLIAAALATRWLLNRYKERLPSWTIGVRLYVDTLWVFLVLTFAVNRGLTLLINPSAWIAERRIVVWFTDTRSELFIHVRFLENAWDTLMRALSTVFGGAMIPLLWLAVAGIVYGVSGDADLRAAARRLAGARADGWFGRATPASQRLHGRWARTPNLVREKVHEHAVSRLGKFKPISDSARLIAHGGLLGMSLYVLAYLGLAWLDMSGSFYGTQLSPGYLFRAMAWALGPHPLPFWNGVGDTLQLISHLLVEPLRVCLVAAALAYCLHHVRATTPRPKVIEPRITTEVEARSDRPVP